MVVEPAGSDTMYFFDLIKTKLKSNPKMIEAFVDYNQFATFARVSICEAFQRICFEKKNKDEIKQFKNIHEGERCFIVGLGPSLTKDDLNLISNEKSFAVNRGYELVEKTNWKPDYYLVLDDSNLRTDNLISVANGDYVWKAIFTQNYRKLPECKQHIYKLCVDNAPIFRLDTTWHKNNPDKFPSVRLSKDISQRVCGGKTVVMSCINIAIYMGFKEIYLIGVDCDYDQQFAHTEMINEDASDEAIAIAIKSAVKCREQFSELLNQLPNDIKVYNATRGGALEAFERIDVEKVININEKI